MPTSETASIRIVLIEDDSFYRRTVRRVLQHYAGDRITVVGEAGNARDGVRLARSIRPDLVLSGLQMPLDPGPPFRASPHYGIAAIRVIKRSPWGAGIRILVLSNFDVTDDEDVIAKAIRAGADGYLFKPAAARDGGAIIASAIEQVVAGGSVFFPPELNLAGQAGDTIDTDSGENYGLEDA